MTSVMGRVVDGAVAALIGLAVGIPVATAVHDILPNHPPVAVSWSVLVMACLMGALTLGRVGARSVGATGRPAAAAAILGAAVAAGWVAAPLIDLLGEDVPPAAVLAWTLGEEDNAQIIGIAREVIVSGPRGGDLAEQYGTGFVIAATTLGRLVGSDPAVDPRLEAIRTFTLSTLLAVVVLALGAALLAVLAAAPRPSPPRWRTTLPVALVTGVATLAVTAAALAVTVVLPMRTGFLSFVWGFTWVAIGTALLPLMARSPGRVGGAVLALQAAAATLLLIRSWPFLLAAAVPALALLARSLPWARAIAAVRRHPVVAVAGLVVLTAGATRFLLSSALGEVLSYGREAFTVAGSGIGFDDRLVAAIVVAFVVVVATRAVGGGRAPTIQTLSVVGPVAATLVSWLLLRGAAEVIADGEFNYAGTKLLYGVVAVGAITVLPAAAARWWSTTGAGTALRGAAFVAVLVLLATSPTVRTIDTWLERLAPATPPHAIAMVEAIERTTPDLPVRCRPARGTVVTDTSRWAAYFCVRWVEDALNDDRRSAFRDRLLFAPEGTFDAIVAEADAEGLYGFAYVMPLGPGWFGWDGRS